MQKKAKSNAKWLILYAILLSLFITGATFNIGDSSTYKAPNLTLSALGKKTNNGVLVLPRTKDFKLIVEHSGEVNKLRYYTVHGLKKFSRGQSRNRRDNKVELDVNLNFKLEKDSPIIVYAFEAHKDARVLWGKVLFTNPKYGFDNVLLHCNKSISDGNNGANQHDGTGACAAMSGFVQGIEFPTPVEMQSDKRCGEAISTQDKMFYKYTMLDGDCVYEFYSTKGRYILYTIGYEREVFHRKDIRKGQRTKFFGLF